MTERGGSQARQDPGPAEFVPASRDRGRLAVAAVGHGGRPAAAIAASVAIAAIGAIGGTAVVGGAGCGAGIGGESPAGAIDLTIAPGFIDTACAAWDGEAYAVAWATHTDQQGLASSLGFARISPAGELVRAPQTLFQGLNEVTTACRLLPVPGAEGAFELLFSEEDGDIELFRFTSTGAIVSSPNELADEPGRFDVALREGEYTILYADYYDSAPRLLLLAEGDGKVEIDAGVDIDFIALRWGDELDTFYALLAGDGDVGVAKIPAADPQLLDAVEVGDDSEYNHGPVSLVVAGDAVYGSWMQDDEFVFQAFDLSFAPQWPQAVPVLPQLRAAPGGVSMDSFGDSALVAWQSDHETSLPQIYAAALPRDPTAITSAVQISDGLHSYREPQVIVGPDSAAVIFEGSAAGSERLFWAPVSIAP